METLLSVDDPVAFEVRDATHAGAARQAAQRLAASVGFDATDAGRVAIVATEAVTNIVKHAGSGTFLARPIAAQDRVGIEMLAIDAGPGMASFEDSARDGVSSAGTSGTGLGAIHRLCAAVDAYTRPGAGTVLRMELWRGGKSPPAGPYEVGAVRVSKRGETACGDAWSMVVHAEGLTLALADGLGHGPDASRAAAMAVETLRGHEREGAVRLLDLAHARLRPTRGAAVAVMRLEAAREELAYAGVGNLSAVIVEAAGRRALVSHNGIVGHNLPRAQEFRYPFPAGALLVAHSDGLDTRWDLAALPGIVRCHPSVIAAALYRGHSRGRDDVAVVVARARR